MFNTGRLRHPLPPPHRPVLVRDWSIRTDLFTGTVEASANTWKFRNAATRHMTAKDARDLVAAEYLRPFLAQSDYLETAVSRHPGPPGPRPGYRAAGASCWAANADSPEARGRPQ